MLNSSASSSMAFVITAVIPFTLKVHSRSPRFHASSVILREQMVQACLHAGYSAYFTLNSRAGEVCGYRTVPCGECLYTEEEMEELQFVG